MRLQERQIDLVVRGAVLAAITAGVVAVGGCQKNNAGAATGSANATSPTAGMSPAAASPAAAVVASTLPAECRALLTALQSCSDHLTAANSPVAAQFRMALQQTRETLPAAADDPGLPAQCAKSLKDQSATAHDLGC